MKSQQALLNQIENSWIREASMASMALGIGLTQIRRYDFTQPGFFYSGLYSITTGIERLLKIILIYDYRIRNDGKFPDNSQLKGFSHNLFDMWCRAVEINEKYGFQSDDASIFETDNLYEKIIRLLSDFAFQTRYYNLDYLTGKQQSNGEPLERWDKEICAMILDRHYKPQKRDIAVIKKLAEMMENYVLIRQVAEDSTAIENLADFMLLGRTVLIKQKYSMYYLYVIVRFLSKLCTELEFHGDFFPFLREFFMIFRNPEKDEILRKKSWNPHAPYRF
jgi:hypothetical protein